MATPIMMPRQGQSVETCVINEWFKKPGEEVKEGDILFSYETDKASFEFESPTAGVLLETFFSADDDVPVLTNVGVIGAPGENVDEFRPSGADQGTVPSEPAQTMEQPQASQEEPAQAQAVVAGVAPAAQAAQETGVIRVSPRARAKATVRGVDIASVAGTGPKGRVIERDVLAQPGASPTAVAKMKQTGLQAPRVGSGIGAKVLSHDLAQSLIQGTPAPHVEDTVEEVKLTNIRKIIGQRMMESLQQTAQLTMNGSADATALLEYRKRAKGIGADLGMGDITVTDLVAMAVARTLPSFPELNCLYQNDKLRQFAHVHLAMAVDTSRGLMVPVVRFADLLTVKDLSISLKDLAKQCKEGSINPDLLSGGTVTITNLGMFGIESFTPVLNPPQVAIIGVNSITPRPKLMGNGEYQTRPYLTFSLTIDHRVVDGGPGARFLKALCTNIENIDFMLSAWQ